jgi:hypothetical protein
MKKKKLLLLLPGLGVLAACWDAAGPRRDVALNEPFELAVGESAELDAGALRVSFLGVTNDSRCPIDVVCIVAGDATVRLRLVRRSRPAELIELVTPSRPCARADAYEIEALRLLPAPRAARPTPPEAYLVGLVVRRP